MENKKLGQEPAYPVDGNYASDAFKTNNAGMSKRFYAACAAMQGLLSNVSMMQALSKIYPNASDYPKISKQITVLSYIHADELLKQENE